MSKKAIIFGAGSFAEVVSYYLANDSDYEVCAYTVDGDRIKVDLFNGTPLVPWEDIEKSYPPGKYELFVAIGYADLNKVRQKICEAAKSRGYKLLSYVCSKATTWPDLDIGTNCFIFEDNTIQPFSRIGDGTILWSGNHIGHHTEIGKYCFITSHVVVSGHCKVGDRCFIGVNATIADSVSIAADNLIGPHTLMQKNTGDCDVYLGDRTKKYKKDSTKFFR